MLGRGKGAVRWDGVVESLCHPDAGWPWETGEGHAIGKLGVWEANGYGMKKG